MMGATRQLWLKWKMLKLPWRKTFLVGMPMPILRDLNRPLLSTANIEKARIFKAIRSGNLKTS
jgi:hypothetical protein